MSAVQFAHQSEPRRQVWRATLRYSTSKTNNNNVRKYLIRLAVFAFTTFLGSVGGLISTRERGSVSKNAVAEIHATTSIGLGCSFCVSDSDPDLPKSLSPYDITLFAGGRPNVNMTKLWRALKIDTGLFNGLPTSPSFFPIKCDHCEAETFEYDLDGLPGTEVLLRLGGPVDYSYRYLIFKYVENSWRVIGHIDAWGKYRKPQHTIIVNHYVTWLNIEEQGATGSGVATYVSSVYRVTPRRVIKAFTYLSDGHQAGFSEPSRDFNAQVVDCSIVGNQVTAVIAYSVIYYTEDFELFGKTQRVTISKSLDSDFSGFDRAHSELSKAELEDVYNIDTLTNEGFLKYNYAELMAIARGKDLERKQWLNSFLERCKSTVERRQLRQLLVAK